MYGPEVLCNSFMQLYIVLSRHVDNKGTHPHFCRTIKVYPGRNKNDSSFSASPMIRCISPFTTTLSSRKRAFCASWRRNHDFSLHIKISGSVMMVELPSPFHWVRWFQIFFFFPLLGEMTQFDDFFFTWVETTTYSRFLYTPPIKGWINDGFTHLFLWRLRGTSRQRKQPLQN